MIKISIIPFEEKFVKIFYDLNVEWLQKYFYVEPYDKKVLSNPQEYIIDKGGFIFFATYKNKIVGTVALINKKECFELSKMAVLPKYHGQKIGQQLMDYCIDFSKNKGWKNIMLYSNRILEPAISLYKKVGFKEVELEKDVYYERANIKMKLEL
ncbi:GNAT family N-acetyltransferase [Polaribacter uvawellassae]|uniref:GNAT family N-acetyltransferase n=1 Tax=Polaribacter uvawellassae TaxID=3133495 RepID=UPI0032191B1E